VGDAVGRRISGRAVRKEVSPAILPQSDSVHTLLWNAHYYLAFAFLALVLLHVAAALFHALVRRDGVFETIAPLPLRDQAAPADV
jgi:cytochrome b561